MKVLDFGSMKPPSTSDRAWLPTYPCLPAGRRRPSIRTPASFSAPPRMSPEQARGKVVDRRSDVWVAGCVLVRDADGPRAFGGDDLTLTLAAIVKDEPDWNALPANTPPAIRRLLRRTLTKESRNAPATSPAPVWKSRRAAPVEQQETRAAVPSRSSSRVWPAIAAALAPVTMALVGIVL